MSGILKRVERIGGKTHFRSGGKTAQRKMLTNNLGVFGSTAAVAGLGHKFSSKLLFR